ncbi:MAG: TetR/AcrR family transcriptional regulator [Gemmatimonadales bacterium]
MPRCRSFDPTLVLDRAMELFWLRGYGETSIGDLVRWTGVNRSGLYGTFGDKHDLFLKALTRYREHIIGPLLVELEAPGAASAELHHFFARVAAWLTGPEGRRGCLMCNTAVELGAEDEMSMRAVGAHFRRLREAIARALQTAKRRGEVPAEVEPRRDADLLLGVVQGAFVLVRGGQHPETVRDILRTALWAVGDVHLPLPSRGRITPGRGRPARP